MAAIERGEGGEDHVVRAWLAKAVTASRGPQWICEVDGQVYPEWQPVTEGGFDTLTWKTAPTANTGANTSGVLPLLVDDVDARVEPAEPTQIRPRSTKLHDPRKKSLGKPIHSC